MITAAKVHEDGDGDGDDDGEADITCNRIAPSQGSIYFRMYLYLYMMC